MNQKHRNVGFANQLSRTDAKRLISIDVGNTLVTSRTLGIGTLLARAAGANVALPHQLSRLHTERLTQELVDELSLVLGIESIDLSCYEPPQAIILPGVVGALATLKSLGIRIVTLSNVASIDATPLPAELAEHIDAQYQSFRIGAAKPNPKAFAAMLRAENILPGSTVHIGDSLRCDANGALSAGISAIWIASPQQVRENVLPPNLIVVDSFVDAVNVLLAGC